MAQTIRKYIIEGSLFFATLIVWLKAFHYLEVNNSDLLTYLLNTIFSESLLFAILTLSIILSNIACLYFKTILEPVNFIASLKSLKIKEINIKKLVLAKEALFLIALAVLFYFSYNNIIYFNDYSLIVFCLILIFYIPLSTALTIKKQLEKNKLTLTEFKIYRKNKNDSK